MKVSDAKAIAQQLLHAEPWNKDDILQRYPELVTKSQQLSSPVTLYRVLKLDENNAGDIQPHKTACTSKSFASLVNIADKMPSMLWGDTKMISLASVYLRFEVPQNCILLDMDRVVLPAIKDKLKNVMHHKLENKWGERLSIEYALQEYTESGENEVVVDLTDLKYTAVACPNHSMGSIRQHNVKHLLKNQANQLSTSFNCPTQDLLFFKDALSHADYLTGLKCLKLANILDTTNVPDISPELPAGEPAF